MSLSGLLKDMTWKPKAMSRGGVPGETEAHRVGGRDLAEKGWKRSGEQ